MTVDLNSRRGQALIEVLIASVIVLIVTASMVAMLQTQSQETRALTQKVNAIELQRALTLLMTDSSVCQAMIATSPVAVLGTSVNGQFTSVPNGAGAGAQPLITVGQPVSSTAPDLVVKRIYFDEVQPTGTANQYLAWLRVAFATERLVRPLAPIGARFTLTTDGAGKVNGCINNGSSAPGAVTTQTSPGGKCITISKAMVRGAPDVGTNGSWSSMGIPCPSSFPVATSVAVTPAAYATFWSTRYQAAGTGAYFGTGVCDMMYMRDDPRTTPLQLAQYAGSGIDQGACAVQCCNF